MKISTNTVHVVTFNVEAFWSEEGGMGHATFGKTCDTINAALTQLDLANIHDPDVEWIITCDVTRHVNAGTPI